jgi:prolipoprotein diacylglyceryltransferase/predicted O-methyltransferase YrrM
MMWVAFMVGYFVLHKDITRRRIDVDPQIIVLILAFSGVLGAKLWHVMETPNELFANPSDLLFSTEGFAWYGGLLAGAMTLFVIAKRQSISWMKLFDAAAPACALGYAVGRIGCLLSGDGDYGTPTKLPWGMSFEHGIIPTPPGVLVHPTPIYEFIVGCGIFAYLWYLGVKSLRGPRASGEVVASLFLFSGITRFMVEFIRINPRVIFGMSNAQFFSLLTAVGGAVMLVIVRMRFRAMKGEHRILEHASEKGDVLQPEYHRATVECPHPERWKMYDSMTAEYEVLQFLHTLVTTIKPELVVETGTFMGVSTLKIAEGLQENGFGKVISLEYDAKVFEKAKARVVDSGLSDWIELRNESSLDAKINGEIDLLFSDSDPPLREQEVRRFLPQMNPYGLVLMHDASSHLATVREAAKKMEQEGLISIILMPTPRGLVIAQKREGRS